MPQQMNYLNLPGITGAVEATKAARLQNQLYQQQLDAAQQPQPVDPELLYEAALTGKTPELWDRNATWLAESVAPEFGKYVGQFDQRGTVLDLLKSKIDPAKAIQLQEIHDPESPTGTRFVPRGEAVGAAGPAKAGALQTKIEALTAVGVPQDVATKTAAGAYKQVQDVYGRGVIVDTTSGAQIWPQQEAALTPAAAAEAPPPIAGGAEATGGAAFLGEKINTITDFFGAGLQFQDISEARERLDALKVFTTLGLAGDLAGRDTNMVRELILGLFPETAKLTMGDERSLVKYTAIRDHLRNELQFQQTIADNPYRNDPKDVQKARSATANLGNMVGVFDGVIENWNRKPGEAGLPEDIPAGSRKVGTSNGNPVYETPDGRRLVVE